MYLVDVDVDVESKLAALHNPTSPSRDDSHANILGLMGSKVSRYRLLTR